MINPGCGVSEKNNHMALLSSFLIEAEVSFNVGYSEDLAWIEIRNCDFLSREGIKTNPWRTFDDLTFYFENGKLKPDGITYSIEHPEE